jgi:DNA-directed RNA polymerase subunit RPC12/RpoP
MGSLFKLAVCENKKEKIVSASKSMAQENKRNIIVTWQLACRQCRANFVVEVPFGPKEERELKCPDCGSKDIGRIEGLTQDAPQCGG